MTEQSSDLLRAWKESAFYWQKHRAVLGRILAPITQGLLSSISLQDGEKILDVACGSGEPSLTIADSFPFAKIISTDPVGEMLASARTEARQRNLDRISFCRCRGERLSFLSGSFDAAICRLGAMFFPDSLGGLKEILRTLRPGGRMALAVWHLRSENPMFSRVSEVLERYIPSVPEDPDQPGAFRFAETGRLSSLLRQAGAVDVHESVLAFRMEAPVSIDEFWSMRAETSETIREKIALLSPSQITSVERDVKAAVQEFFQNQTMSFPARVNIVSGKQPG